MHKAKTAGLLRALSLLTMVLLAAGCEVIPNRVVRETVLVPVTRVVTVLVPSERPTEGPRETESIDRVLTALAEASRREDRTPEAGGTPPPFPPGAATKGEAGAAAGVVFWNDEPVQGVRVKLCREWVQFTAGGDCREEQYSSITDALGRYDLPRVPSGSYYLATRYPGQASFSCWSGPFSATCVPWVGITGGRKVNLPKVELVKQDLELLSPAEGEEVKGAGLVLRWKAYPQAARYEVYLRRIDPWERVLLEETREPYLKVSQALEVGQYWWDVNAFNQKGTKIAEPRRFFYFAVR